MKRFEFRLASVQKLREQEYDKAEQAVLEQQATLARERDGLRIVHEEKRRIRQERVEYARALDLLMVEWSRAYELGVDQRISLQEIRVQEASKELQKRKKLLQEALKQKKIFEKLEQKAKEKYMQERQKFEQKFFDDIASLKMQQSEKGR
jgi:flagellar export protein FliJ